MSWKSKNLIRLISLISFILGGIGLLAVLLNLSIGGDFFFSKVQIIQFIFLVLCGFVLRGISKNND
jgi:hypothetical protein